MNNYLLFFRSRFTCFSSQYFIGELTQDQVLQALQLAQQVPDIRTHVERSVMGRLGPIAKDLKDLRASGIREWSFDAGKSPGLAKIRDLDKGIGDALAEVLAELKVQTMEIPADDELRTLRTWLAPFTDVSIGKLTNFSTSSGAMPCASVSTTTVGAVRSGNTSTSIRIAT